MKILVYLVIPFLVIYYHYLSYQSDYSSTPVNQQIKYNMSSSILYNEWSDGINYQRKCFILQKLISQNNSRKIIHRGYPGGLGHKYWSLIQSIVNSILLKNTLIIDLPLSFVESTSNCLSSNLIGSNIFFPKSVIFNTSTCSNIGSIEKLKETVYSTQYAEFIDCRLPTVVAESIEVETLLRDSLFIDTQEGINDAYKYITRILLNPTPAIMRVIDDFADNYFSNKVVLGVHVRTGGCIANFHEPRAMMTLDELKLFPSFVKSVMKESEMSLKMVTLFLSTDSDIVEEYIKAAFNNQLEIITSNLYARSHSRGKAMKDAVKGSITDLYLLSRASVLIMCSGSGFSKIAYYLSSATQKYVYNTTHHIDEKWDKVSKKCTSIPDFNSW